MAFVNSLYSGAISLGVARFVLLADHTFSDESFDKLSTWIKMATFPGPAIGLLTALGFVLDDWRHARWVNEDYGYRVDPNGKCIRYWCDCGIAILSFFLVSSSLLHPTFFLFLLGVVLSLGGIWSWSMERELKWHLRQSGSRHYPENSLGLTIESIREHEPNLFPDSIYKADYRVSYVTVTHRALGPFIMMLAGLAFVGTWVAAAIDGVKLPTHEGQLVMWVIGGICAILCGLAHNSAWLALALLLGLKYRHHIEKERWVERYRT